MADGIFQFPSSATKLATSAEVATLAPATTENSYAEVVAASASPIVRIRAKWWLYNPGATANDAYIVYLATGAAGSEVVRDSVLIHADSNTLDDPHVFNGYLECNLELAAGTRIAMKYDNVSGTNTFGYVGYSVTVEERA